MAKQQLDPAQVQRDLERFAAALKESEKADKAKQQRTAQAGAKARELSDAQAELQRAVEAVRQAKQSGKGRAEADAAWKVAKARVIELETGARPSWAPAVAEPAADEPAAAEEPAADPETAADEPAED